MISLMLYSGLISLSQPAKKPLYDRAVEARHSGQTSLAIRLLERLVTEDPRNADAWVQYGFALRDTGSPKKAQAAFQTALELAPDYADAKMGLASLHRDEPATVLKIQLDMAQTAVKNAQNWTEVQAGVIMPLHRETTLSATIERSRRYGNADLYGETRVDTKFSGDLSVYGLAGGTIKPDYKPGWTVGAGISQRLTGDSPPLFLTFDGVGAHYREGVVWTASPGIQQYTAGGRLWFTGKWINVFTNGRHEGGVSGRADLQATSSLRFFGGVARAPDLTEGMVIQTRSIFAGAVGSVSRSLELRIAIANDAPSNGLNRRTISAGLGIPLK